GEARLKLKELIGICRKLFDRVLNLEKTKTAQAKEIADLKKCVKKLERKTRSRTPWMNLFKIGTYRRRCLGKDDASKQGRNLKQRYKAAFTTVEGFVNSSEILEKQKNRSDKGYHAVPPPFTRNYMTLKCDLRLIDEHNKSVYMDVISNISPIDAKTVKTVDVNHKGLCRKLFDRVLDLKKTKTAHAKENADLKKNVKKLERKTRSRTPGMNLFKIGTYRRRCLGKDDASKQGRNLKQRGGLLGLKDFLVLLKLLELVMVSTADFLYTIKTKLMLIEDINAGQ
nr:hypothetical protein [Tanacetum cinerariifolium]